MKKYIFLLIFVFTNVNANEDLKEYLKEGCKNHELAKEFSHGLDDGMNWERCYKIGSAQAKFETNWGELGAGKTHNNIYGFRRNGFMYFDNKRESIDWYINRYYKFDRYKTIYQITIDSYYCSPITGWCGWIKGFTYTKEHQPHYYNFVRNYFLNN